MLFKAVVEPSGNATAVRVPAEVLDAFGAGRRPPVTITINGHTWRSRVAAMRGLSLIGISAAHRKGAGIEPGDEVEVEVTLDTEPRVVVEPPDFAAALDADPAARAAYDKLAYSHKRQHVRAIEDAKTEATRQRRIAKAVQTIVGD
ncbi:YdeI/OmpD-associated family protein [Spirillospora sp. NPDC047279]|uniref:YdeI/OmpD-associated family protein n=1 Tax=Spirillospora sp. NPDC047279 TaxID=3155478 RepID=UPI00340A06FD